MSFPLAHEELWKNNDISFHNHSWGHYIWLIFMLSNVHINKHEVEVIRSNILFSVVTITTGKVEGSEWWFLQLAHQNHCRKQFFPFHFLFLFVCCLSFLPSYCQEHVCFLIRWGRRGIFFSPNPLTLSTLPVWCGL